MVFFGGRSISGENIVVSVDGPFSIGGGEELPLTITVANRNSVPMESATLIIEYPRGTQSASEDGELLSTETISLDRIRAGEAVNVPIRAVVFGEENEELQFRTAVEYRVSGSNATFFTEGDPYRVKVSSSPVTLTVDSIEEVTSGQEVSVDITIQSNTESELSDLLVTAEYPQGFEVLETNRDPLVGQGTWRIGALGPEESMTISITGRIVSNIAEARVLRVSVGVGSDQNATSIASVFDSVTNEYEVTEPFITVSLIGSDTGNNTVSVLPDTTTGFELELINTRSDTLYNARAQVAFSGTAAATVEVIPLSGYYDSNSRTITWDTSTNRDLSEIAPGESETLRFRLQPRASSLQTPQLEMSGSVFAQRVRERAVSESLIGSAEATLRVAGATSLTAQTLYGDGPFADSGPIPPVVGEQTTYSVQLQAKSGTNAITDATVEATLPTYVTWVSPAVGDGQVTFNASNRTVRWTVGNVDANQTVSTYLHLGITPSDSQLNDAPVLLERPEFRASDRFTGDTVRDSLGPVTTQLAGDSGGTSGRVRE